MKTAFSFPCPFRNKLTKLLISHEQCKICRNAVPTQVLTRGKCLAKELAHL